MEIILKTYQNLFNKIINGEKTFDVRLGDKDIKKGDIVILKEINNNREFTGRELKKKIKFIFKTKDLDYWNKEDIDKFGYIVFNW